MSLRQPILPDNGTYIQYMSTGLAFDTSSLSEIRKKPFKCVVLASHLPDQKLSKLTKSLEHVFTSDCKEEKVNVGVYTFVEHYEGLTSHYLINHDGFFVYLLTTMKYSHRCAHKLLEEFTEVFVGNFKKRIPKSKEGELSKQSKHLFTSVIEKYEDVEGIDSLFRTQQKLDNVKSVMSDNVSLLLENQDSVEKVLHRSEDLNRDAAVFKKNTKKLKFQMLCKSRKWCIILSLFILLVLGGIVGVVYYVTQVQSS